MSGLARRLSLRAIQSFLAFFEDSNDVDSYWENSSNLNCLRYLLSDPDVEICTPLAVLQFVVA